MGDTILYRSTNGFGADIADLKKYKIMTVVINEEDSNPETCCSYADDAVNMQSGASANAQWQEFFGYKPCLFKNGQVVGYLNPNDYSKFENGGTADITSGNAGDVMIEFPRRGIRSVKDGNTIRISMTDAPNDPDFKYYAHQRGTVPKEAFYIGAYPGVYTNGEYFVDEYADTMRSLSGQNMVLASNPTAQWSNVREQCKNNGDGYESFPYILMVFIQIMYVLQFKNLYSVDMLGMRFIDAKHNTTASDGTEIGHIYYKTGSANTKGLFFKNEYDDDLDSVVTSTKTFGLEDLLSFGYLHDGVALLIQSSSSGMSTTATYKVCVALGPDEYRDDITKYTVVADSSNFDNPKLSAGFISKCIGISECPFFPCGRSNSMGSTNPGYYSSYLNNTGNSGIFEHVKRVVTCRTTKNEDKYDDEYSGLFTIELDPNRTVLGETRLCYI